MAAFFNVANKVSRQVAQTTGLSALSHRLAFKPSTVPQSQALSMAEPDGYSWQRADKPLYRTVRTALPFIGIAVCAGGSTAFLLTVMNSRKATMKAKK